MEFNREKITGMIEAAVKKLQADDDLMAQFQKEPVKALEKLLGIDLPEEQIQAVLTGIKTKLQLDDLNLDSLAGLAELAKNADALRSLGSLFGNK